MMTFAVLNLIGGLDSIATLFKFIQSPVIIISIFEFFKKILKFNKKKLFSSQ